MENKRLSSEEKANLALESLDGIQSIEIPNGLEEKMLARFENESVKSKTPKWFWAAAVLLLAINVGAVCKYSFSNNSSEQNSTSSNTMPQKEIGTYYFGGENTSY